MCSVLRPFFWKMGLKVITEKQRVPQRRCCASRNKNIISTARKVNGKMKALRWQRIVATVFVGHSGQKFMVMRESFSSSVVSHAVNIQTEKDGRRLLLAHPASSLLCCCFPVRFFLEGGAERWTSMPRTHCQVLPWKVPGIWAQMTGEVGEDREKRAGTGCILLRLNLELDVWSLLLVSRLRLEWRQG